MLFIRRRSYQSSSYLNRPYLNRSYLKRKHAHPTRGFALLEVLIALAVVAVAGVALLGRMQSIASSTTFIEERTVAHWVAENIMQETIANYNLQRDIKRVRNIKDRLDYDGREWHWTTEIEEVPIPPFLAPAKMYRLEIKVGLEEDKPMATLIGFLGE